MSTIRYAPTDFAIFARRSKSIFSANADAPATISFGLCSFASFSAAS